MVIKAETHNHPTAISPFAGAATGSGGEIRDEAATGRGARPVAGMCGFVVSDLRLADHLRPWETEGPASSPFASPQRIIIEAPIGAARYNNEFGRPCIGGFFRTFECWKDSVHWGYQKPIMIAAGMGTAKGFFPKSEELDGALIVVLGGPAMHIGIGGGSLSSRPAGKSCGEQDYASVQRANAEMQRRCQEVIDRCVAFESKNPILSIHDVGAGGLANAVPEMLAAAGCGGTIELSDIPSADLGMSPLELWCNEAQERYVLAIARDSMCLFSALCASERCPAAVVGSAKKNASLTIRDRRYGNKPACVPMSLLFGYKPDEAAVPLLISSANGANKSLSRRGKSCADSPLSSDSSLLRNIDLGEAAERTLKFPATASKNFLITIGDRTVGGLIARDQLVGPHQMPVSDCAVCANDYTGFTGQAMAMGERCPVAVINAPASGRLAVAEALSNIFAADIRSLSDIKLSANWMAAHGFRGQDRALYETVRTVANDLCLRLGIAIPVGKDSLSMSASWRESGARREVVSPLSLVVTSFAAVADIRKTCTPELARDEDAVLLLIDLSRGKNRLGGSVLEQAYGICGKQSADLDCPEDLLKAHTFLQRLRREEILLAYHDRSDGGLFATLCEMAFAAHVGLEIKLECKGAEAPRVLFAEEPGFVIQVAADTLPVVESLAADSGLGDCCHEVGRVGTDLVMRLLFSDGSYSWALTQLKKWWWDTSYLIQSLRDDSFCAQQERAFVLREDARGLNPDREISFLSPSAIKEAPGTKGLRRPKVAVLREQGVNGQREMAAAFHAAGFTAVDVCASDLAAGKCSLKSFHGLAACGGFSFGDVLGAGRGWAAGILHNSLAREQMREFFERTDTFALGVCNGCQMFSQIKELIPGANCWPRFVANKSRQFEARLCLVEVLSSPAIFFTGMANSFLIVPVAHGEGRVVCENGIPEDLERNTCLRYVDNENSKATEHYPENPNGSVSGVTGFCNDNGRVAILMPHPERVFRGAQFSWKPKEWKDESPWSQFFKNAKFWLDG